MLDSLKNMVEVCGSRAHLMKQSLWISVTVAVLQGIAYALFFPLFAALFTNQSDAWIYLTAVIAITIVEGALRLWGNHTEWLIYLEVADEARLDLAEQLKRIPLESLGTRRAGDLNHVLTGNVQEVVGIASGLYGVVLNSLIAPSVTIVALLFIDWRVALAMIVIFPLAAPLYRTLRKLGAKSNTESTEAHAHAASEIIEYVQGLAVLRATRQVGSRSQRLQKSIAHLRDTQAASTKLGTMPSLLMAGIVQLGIVLVTMLATYFALGGSLGIAAVCALVAVSIRFSEPLSLFANMSQMFDFMEAGLARIHELMSVKPLPQEPAAETITTSEVALNNVTFAYSGSTSNVLTDLTLTFPERSMTALVGSSGSGKTTVTKLMSRYADPQTGTVTIGGVDIRSVKTEELMRHISVVFQDVYLFDDSIRENIRMAKPDATDPEVVAAAQAANCHHFISRLPLGYETRVGEIGSALSGGERQRISIARAILKDAPIVILDEPTSALDTESEVAVQAAIDALIQDKTVIVIAHRLSTIAAADNIIVLEEGQCVEQGTHKNLIDENGRYAQLWAAQQSSRQWQVTHA